MVAVALVLSTEQAVFNAAFIADGASDGVDKVRLKGGGKAYGLWEYSGAACAGDAVEGFIPPLVFGYAQALDGGGVVLQLGDFSASVMRPTKSAARLAKLC